MAERLGNFELVEELGSGAWGRVHRARQVNLGGRAVAVKTLWPQLAADPAARQRFIDEANSTARLSHPHIVKIIDVGEQAGTYYFAMEYVEGEPLADVMARRGALPPAQVAEIGAQIAEALGHAHSRGVIHRDIKPGNIMIDTRGRAAVTDFGIAKVGEGSGLTATGAAIGTPEYMSPEQAQGNPVDGRSDLYSLGIVLYHMATGHVPFTGPTPVSVGMRHVNEQPRDPRRVRPEIPEWLAAAIMRAIAKQPGGRFATGEELAAALRSAAGFQPTAAPAPAPAPTVACQPQAPVHPSPTPQATVLAPQARSGNRRVMALLISAIAVVLLLLIVGIWQRNRRGGRAPRPAPPVVTPAGGGGGGGAGGGSGAVSGGPGPTGDPTGGTRVPPNEWANWKPSLFPVQIGEKLGYINSDGEVAIAPQYAWAEPFSEGLAAVMIGTEFGYIDTAGNVVIEPQFGVASEFSEGLAAVATEEGTGYIDKSGKMVFKPQFIEARAFRGGLARVWIDIDRHEYYITPAGAIVWMPPG